MTPLRGPYGRVAARIGSPLAKIRCEKRRTHAECAVALGISERAYGALERADFVPDSCVAPLAELFGMERDALVHQLDGGSIELPRRSDGAA